jgi:hypothetical protein
MDEVDRMSLIERRVSVTFDSHGWPTLANTLDGRPVTEHAQQGGKTVEYVPADTYRGAVAALREIANNTRYDGRWAAGRAENALVAMGVDPVPSGGQ